MAAAQFVHVVFYFLFAAFGYVCGVIVGHHRATKAYIRLLREADEAKAKP